MFLKRKNITSKYVHTYESIILVVRSQFRTQRLFILVVPFMFQGLKIGCLD